MSNSTQNDWYDHAVKNPGFKGGLNALKANTHTDWEKRLIKILGAFTQYVQPDVFDAIVDFVKKELADARREALDDMFLAIAKLAEPDERQPSPGDLHTNMDEIHAIRKRLATLREEETS